MTSPASPQHPALLAFLSPRLSCHGNDHVVPLSEGLAMICASCGRTLEGGTKRRRYCDDRCRQRAKRGATIRALDSEAPGSVVAATRAALEAVGRLDTPAGAAALVLAERLDRGGDTGSAVAALVRELRATLAESTADAPVEDSALEGLRRTRYERLRRVGQP